MIGFVTKKSLGFSLFEEAVLFVLFVSQFDDTVDACSSLKTGLKSSFSTEIRIELSSLSRLFVANLLLAFELNISFGKLHEDRVELVDERLLSMCSSYSLFSFLILSDKLIGIFDESLLADLIDSFEDFFCFPPLVIVSGNFFKFSMQNLILL